MKKFFIVVLSVFVLVGCSNQKQDSKIKNEAIEAYVNSLKTLKGKSIAFELDGKIKVPKSISVQSEVNTDFRANGIIDSNSEITKANVVLIDKETSKKEEMEVHIDKKYVYLKQQNQWMKTKNDTNGTKTSQSSETTVDSMKKKFDSFKNVKYLKNTKDGVDGYEIKAKMNFEQLLSLIDEQGQNDNAARKSLKDAKNFLSFMDIDFSIFIAEDSQKAIKYLANVNFGIAQSKINFGPVNVQTKASNDRLKIPEVAKNAKEMKDSAGLIPNK